MAQEIETQVLQQLVYRVIEPDSERLDKLSNWLLAGFAAAVAVLVGNLEKVLVYLGASTLMGLMILFVVVTVLGIVQKLAAGKLWQLVKGQAVVDQVKSSVQAPPDYKFDENFLGRSLAGGLRGWAKRRFVRSQDLPYDPIEHAQKAMLLHQTQSEMVGLQAVAVFLACVGLPLGFFFNGLAQHEIEAPKQRVECEQTASVARG